MNKATLLAAAMLLISASGYGYAQTKDSLRLPKDPPRGASEFSPGPLRPRRLPDPNSRRRAA
jgi:hypothetical protein